MANFLYSSDIIAAGLFAAGEATDGTSDYAEQAIIYLNRGYQAIWMGGAELDPMIKEEWHWLRSTTPGVITINPVISAGTVTVANNSASITFSSAPSVSVQGRFFKTNTNTDVFRISSHTASSTSATLDSVYTGSNSSTEGYKIMQLEYDMPSNVLRILDPIRVYRDNRTHIDGMSLGALERQWPLDNIQGGTPYAFAQVGETKVRFSHYGSSTANDYIRTDFDYLQKPDDLTNTESQPLLPHQWRKILADYITFKLMVDKNDDRADGFGLLVKSGLRAMKKENDHKLAIAGFENGHIFPRPEERAHNTRPLRSESGLIVG